MASATPGDPTLPPLTTERIRSAARILVPVTASEEAKGFIAALAEQHQVPMVSVAEVNEEPVIDRGPGDVLIHSVPDVFGRVRDPSVGWEVACVHHRIASSMPLDGCISPIEYGREPDEGAEIVISTLATTYKRLCQQRGVRPVFGSPAPFGLAFIAPEGIELDCDQLVARRVDLPGLPDLVVVGWA